MPTIKRIADKWTELFVKQNGDLFTSVSAASFQFLRAQYDEILGTLTGLEREKQQYQAENPLPPLEDLLVIQQGNLREGEQRLADTAQELLLTQAALDNTLREIEGLSIDGQWGGLALDPDSEEIALVSENTLAQSSLNRAKVQFFTIQERVNTFRNENELGILDDQLAFTKGLLNTLRRELAVAEQDLLVKQASLDETLREIEGLSIDGQWGGLVLNPSS